MNTYIRRAIEESIIKKLQPNKVVVLLGARRVGKTLLLNYLIENSIHEPYVFLNGEDMAVQALLAQRTAENYKRLLGDKKLLIVDEAQKVEGIGQILKLMVDSIEGLKVIATGSSVFDLANKSGEPLTGRKYTFKLFPLAQMEYSTNESMVQTRAKLEERLIYGCYPELVHLPSNQEKATYLNEMADAYLLKDILEFDGIRNSDKMFDLLRLIAFQIGKEISLDELGRQLAMSRNTVEKYLDLLSKVFVIYKLPGFSRNLRSEITKTNRWYFYDNGIRNALIRNFNPLSIRNDAGELWENYVLAERVKYQSYTNKQMTNFFWRTYEQQEIDWIEESGGKLMAYEIKWNPTKTVRVPPAWTKAYPESSFQVIHPENYLDWIS
ncbi:MAG: ATP-binding protein [Lentimicrobium sp.]|jgi:predicted AAA+ superfamily ATPase|nr:ATP-binding protein [Lentimicrobium sp.]MDD2527643.1 ATP-binding protein [Lentimicrobiaceae bacterium]MDD4599154.1 ATP-binding protein [Lentimicrobiaceae bacterium]MDY0024552.1 ATP-binding protein [Lentimicrobium sp.]